FCRRRFLFFFNKPAFRNKPVFRDGVSILSSGSKILTCHQLPIPAFYAPALNCLSQLWKFHSIKLFTSVHFINLKHLNTRFITKQLRCFNGEPSVLRKLERRTMTFFHFSTHLNKADEVVQPLNTKGVYRAELNLIFIYNVCHTSYLLKI